MRPRWRKRGVSAVPTSWPTRRRALRDERSFAAVAEEHLDDVYRYLLYMTGNPRLAEDLAAETFERALRRWRRFDPQRGSARTWLCQLARGTALDHFRPSSGDAGVRMRTRMTCLRATSPCSATASPPP